MKGVKKTKMKLINIKKTKNKICPYCGGEITIKRGPGFSSKEEKKCKTSGCEFNKFSWGSSSGWGN